MLHRKSYPCRESHPHAVGGVQVEVRPWRGTQWPPKPQAAVRECIRVAVYYCVCVDFYVRGSTYDCAWLCQCVALSMPACGSHYVESRISVYVCLSLCVYAQGESEAERQQRMQVRLKTPTGGHSDNSRAEFQRPLAVSTHAPLFSSLFSRFSSPATHAHRTPSTRIDNHMSSVSTAGVNI